MNCFHLGVKLEHHFGFKLLDLTNDLRRSLNVLKLVLYLNSFSQKELDRQIHELCKHHLKTHVEQFVLEAFKDEDANLEDGFPSVL